MKIKLDVDNKHFEYETTPLSQERFSALCKLAWGAIGGIVLLLAVRLVGFWAIPWAVGALLLVVLFKALQHI